MGDKRYEAGDTVPETICAVPDEWMFVRFAVDAEITHGNGESKHIYPAERIEDATDLFTNSETTIRSVLADDVQLYTTPRHLLR